jgi:Xaa-Pro aminopeptidase
MIDSLKGDKEVKKLRALRQPASILALVSVLLITMMPSSAMRLDGSDKKSASVIRLTPPAPVIDDAARLAELAARRKRVAQQIGPKAALVLFSAEPRVYTNDVDYHYRQENNLYYLTNLKQKGATLVLVPGNPQLPEILFLPRRDPSAETWTGHMYSPEEARSLSGIGEIWEASEFGPFMQALRARQPYRPKPEAQLLTGNVGSSSRSEQPITPPVPKSEQTTAQAQAATPARPVTGESPSNLTTQNPPTAQTGSQTSQTAQGVKTAASTPATGFEQLFAAMTSGEADLYLLIPNLREPNSREYRQEQAFAEQWARAATGFNLRNAWPIFTEMRLRKSPIEMQLLQHAIDISIEAHERAQAIANRAQFEYEVDAEVLYTFKRRNADNWGYPNIVGCGPNATTLHYIESQSRMTPNALLLMDVGAEYEHYTADVTRTFPVNGKFTKEQAEIYQIVYDAQEAAARATRPGVTLNDVHKAAFETVKDGLLRLGLITDKDSDQVRIWFMHGTSHFLGMNVHDVGTRETKLVAGAVFTNEPGIYIRPDALDYLPNTPENQKFIAAIRPAFEKYKGIGVRIEDDMLVTENGVKWLTSALPRSIPDIENFIARARQEMKNTAFMNHFPLIQPRMNERYTGRANHADYSYLRLDVSRSESELRVCLEQQPEG